MTILALGVVMWAAVHLFPSIFPDLRERLIDAIGAGPYKGVFAADIALSLVLIIWGYRSADWVYVYDPPSWGIHLNNLLMLFAIYLFGVGGARGWLATKLRHPQLTGVIVWAAAHLLANGDQASVLLFGGMALWAAGMIFMINRRVSVWAPPKARGMRAEIMLMAITLLVYAAIVFIHWILLGVKPFPG